MRQSISPLIGCKWGQYAPFYNNLKIDKKNQLVGCTALAIAQIMYYWMEQRGYHRGCKATPKYTTATSKTVVESLPPLTTFDWQHLVAKPKTAEQKKAVAQLCEYIAKALRSDFGRSVTSAKRTIVDTTINTYLRLGNSKHYYESTTGKVKFEEMVYADLAHGRPVFMSGSSTKSGAHSFVIDGYKADTNEYHVNWGWDGQFDGYFPLNKLVVDGDNYNGSKMAVMGIEPTYKLGDVNGDGSITIADVMEVTNMANEGRTSKQADINSDGKVTKEDVELIVQHIVNGDVL